jgi:hypothetical protein
MALASEVFFLGTLTQNAFLTHSYSRLQLKNAMSLTWPVAEDKNPIEEVKVEQRLPGKDSGFALGHA